MCQREKRTVGLRRRVGWALFALSFVPYLLPAEQKPALYVGPTPAELERRHHERRMRNFLGGDVASVFGEDLQKK